MRCTGDVTLQYLVLIFVLKRPHEMLGGGHRGLIIWRPSRSERNEEKASMVCGSGPSDRPLLTSWHFGSRVFRSWGAVNTPARLVHAGRPPGLHRRELCFGTNQPSGSGVETRGKARKLNLNMLAAWHVIGYLFFCKEKGLSQPQVFVLRQLDSSGFLKLTSHRVMLKSNSENVGMYRLSK